MPGTRGRSGGDRTSKTVRSTSGKPITKPATLSAGGAKKWDALIEQIPPNTLTQLDEHNLGLLAELLAQSEQLSKLIEANPADEKSRRFYLQTVDRISKLSAVFGLDPASRAKLKINPESDPESDPYLQFLKS